MKSQFNQASQSCTCTYLFAPPPCQSTLRDAPHTSTRNMDGQPSDSTHSRIPEDRPLNSDQWWHYDSNLSPWEGVITQLLQMILKAPSQGAKQNYAEWTAIMKNRTTEKRTLNATVPHQPPFMHELSHWLARLKKRGPSLARIQRLRNRSNRNNSGQKNFKSLLRPLEVWKYFETIAQLYNYAIFDQICSLEFHQTPTEFLPLCIEYFFTSWPFLSFPDFHCSVSESDLSGQQSNRSRDKTA